MKNFEILFIILFSTSLLLGQQEEFIRLISVDLNGNQQEIEINLAISIPVDSLKKLVISSLDTIDWKPIYFYTSASLSRGEIIRYFEDSHDYLTGMGFLVYRNRILQSQMLRPTKSNCDSENAELFFNCISNAHTVIVNKFLEFSKMKDDKVYIIQSMINLQTFPSPIKDTIFFKRFNKWGIESALPNILFYPYNQTEEFE